MYKGNSASLQRRHKVYEIDLQPQGHVEADFIPTAANMSLAEATEERSKLMFEKVRLEQEHVAAKNGRNLAAMSAIGGKIVVLCDRLSIINKRVKELNTAFAGDVLREAVKEIVSPQVWQQIVERAEAIRIARQAVIHRGEHGE